MAFSPKSCSGPRLGSHIRSSTLRARERIGQPEPRTIRWAPDRPWAGNTTRGVRSVQSYYFTRLIVDAARAIDAAKELPEIDPGRVVTVGRSQGGGLAMIVAALIADASGAIAQQPFLCDLARGVAVSDEVPFSDIAR